MHSSDEIWALALTTDGMSLCAVSPTLEQRRFYAPWPIDESEVVPAIRPVDVVQTLRVAFSAFLADDETAPLALALCTPHRETALCLDKKGFCDGAIYLDMALSIPLHDVPEIYSGDVATRYAYRNSFVRRLRYLKPEESLKAAPGVGTLGSFVAFLLSGHHIDACEPLGIPEIYLDRPGLRTEEIEKALGIDFSISYRSVRTLSPFARISPYFAERLWCEDPKLQVLSGIPIYHLGSCDGARAQMSQADPLNWSIKLGFTARAHWNGKRLACAPYEISINDKKDESNAKDCADNRTLHSEMPSTLENRRTENVESEDKLTVEGLTRLWNERVSLDILPSWRPTHSTYGFHGGYWRAILPCTAVEGMGEDGFIPFHALLTAPLGCAGLHLLTTKNGVVAMGLRSGHGGMHWLRAALESMLYDLRLKRQKFELAGHAPVTLCLDAPWPSEAAQIVSDVLSTKVRYLPLREAELCACGAAMVLLRHLGISDRILKVSAEVYEPSARQAYYAEHFQIHAALIDALA